MRLFEYKLDHAVEVVCENIDRKWPHIEKQLLRAILDAGTLAAARQEALPVSIRQELLSGYDHAVKKELEADPEKQRAINYFEKIQRADGGRRSTIDIAKENGTPRSQRPPTRREYLLEYFKKYLVQADPFAAASGGRKTPYVNHILRWLLNGSAVFPDDIELINELLRTYNKLKNNYGQDVPDLETIDNPNKLRALLVQYRETESYQNLQDKKLPNIVPGIDVYRIDTWNEGKDILCDSGWCIRNKYYFDDYTKPFYVFVSRPDGKHKPKRLALLNVNSGELKDVYNDELPPETVEAIAPILDEIIAGHHQQKYPNSEVLRMIAPIIHLMPQTTEKLSPELLAELARYLQSERSTGHPQRWPAHIEKKLQQDPMAFLAYVEALTSDSPYLYGERNPVLEEELIDLAYTYFDRNFPYIVRLLEYFGERYDEFGGEWPPLKALLRSIKKEGLESEFYRHMRNASKEGVYGFMQLVGEEWSANSR